MCTGFILQPISDVPDVPKAGNVTRTIGRRKLLATTVGIAGAAVVGLGVEERTSALTLWVLTAGSGIAPTQYLSQDWHNDSLGSLTAVDIVGLANQAVALYARIDQTSSYGYFLHTGILDSCEYLLNPGQKKILVDIGSNSSASSIFGTANYQHVFPYNLAAGATGLAQRQIATIGNGTVNAGSSCYTGPHLHQGATGTHLWDPASGAGTPSAGNTAYWYWWV